MHTLPNKYTSNMVYCCHYAINCGTSFSIIFIISYLHRQQCPLLPVLAILAICPMDYLPCWHHIREPHSSQVLGNFRMDLIQIVVTVWNKHFLHN